MNISLLIIYVIYGLYQLLKYYLCEYSGTLFIQAGCLNRWVS